MGSRCVNHWRELSGKCTHTFRNHNFVMGKVQINEQNKSIGTGSICLNSEFEAIKMLIPEGVAIWYLWGNGLAPHYSHPRLKDVINMVGRGSYGGGEGLIWWWGRAHMAVGRGSYGGGGEDTCGYLEPIGA